MSCWTFSRTKSSKCRSAGRDSVDDPYELSVLEDYLALDQFIHAVALDVLDRAEEAETLPLSDFDQPRDVGVVQTG